MMVAAAGLVSAETFNVPLVPAKKISFLNVAGEEDGPHEPLILGSVPSVSEPADEV